MPWQWALRSRPALRKIIIAGAAVVILYTVFGFLVLPAILQSVLPKTLSEALHRHASVRQIRVNPFVLSVTVRGLKISERDNASDWVTAGEIYANLQLASLVRGGPVVREVRVDRPYVRLARRADGSYNFSDLLEENEKKPKKESAPLKYSFNNILVTGGSVDFEDGPRHTEHRIREIRIAVPFVSNLKYYVDRYVRPSFSAVVNGDNVSLSGRTKPFEKSLDTVFDIAFRGLDLPHYLAYLPFRRHYDVPSALLDMNVAVSFSESADGPPTVRVEGIAGLRDVRITGSDGSPMIHLPSVQASIAPANLGERRFRLASLQVTNPEVDVVLDKNRKLNLLSLMPQQDKATTDEDRRLKDPPPGENGAVFTADAIRVEGGTIRFLDASRGTPFRTTLGGLSVAVDGLTTEKGKAAKTSLSFSTEAGERFSQEGTLELSPLASDGSVSLGKIVLGKYAPYYRDAVLFDLKGGTLDLRTGYHFLQGADGEQVRITGLACDVGGLRLRRRGEEDDFLKVPELSVKDADLDLGKREVGVGEFAARKGTVVARREADGALNLQQLVPRRDAATPSAREAASARANDGGGKPTPWTVTLKRVAVDGFSMRFADRSTDPAVEATLDRFRLRANNLSTARNRKGTFSLSTSLNRTGTVSFSGDLGLEPLSVHAKVRADSLPLGFAQPYYAQRVRIVLTAGTVSVDGSLSMGARPGEALGGEYRGELFVRSFASVDKERSEDFLKFETLHFGGVQAGWNPNSLAVQEIALSDFYSRIIVNPDGSLNVQGIVAKTSDNGATAAVPPASAPDNAIREAAVPVRIDALTLQGGNVNFSDHYIRPHYSANLTELGGRVSGLSSEPGVLADVDLRGSLGKAAPLEIKGKINPLADNLYVDLQTSFKDIDLSPMTPYAERYAGYGIEKGKLTLALKYHIEKGKLDADNKVFLDQFTFGSAVDSPQATKLPVRLAVALLKDRNGEIRLDIPVTGELHDPRFSIWGVVWRVVRNLLVKAATAPFALLGAIFGGGGEQLSHLEFAAGLATISDAGTAKLANLAKILKDRPGLTLEVEGHVDVEEDREALRELRFRRKVAAAKAQELAKAGLPVPPLDNVHVAPQEYAKYLALAYKKETFPKPRNFLGIAKTLPAPEMEKLMMANIRITDGNLRRLAEERAAAARDWLIGAGGVAPGRVFLVEGKTLAPEKKESLPARRVDFRIR
jgi:Domain of Unknown Function (DUF748)